MEHEKLLQALQIDINQKGCHSGGEWHGEGKKIVSYSPVDGSLLGTVQGATIEDYERLLDKAEDAFESFRIIPAPKRGGEGGRGGREGGRRPRRVNVSPRREEERIIEACPGGRGWGEAVFPSPCRAHLKTRIREAAATPQLPRTPPSEMRRKTRLPERGTQPGRPTRPSAAQRLRRRSPTRFAKSQPRRRASPRQRGIARGAIPRQRRGTLCRQAKATVFPLWTRP